MRLKVFKKFLILFFVGIITMAFILPDASYAHCWADWDDDYDADDTNALIFEDIDYYRKITPLYAPTDLAEDSKGCLYITEYGKNRIVAWDGYNNAKTFGTTGAGVGQFNKPSGIAIDQQDCIYVADTFNNRIVRFKDANGNGNIETEEWMAWGGAAGDGPLQFNKPIGIFIKGNNIYVADTYNHRIVVFDSTNPAGTWRTFGSNGAGAGQFKAPYDVNADSKDNIWVSDTFNNRVQKFDKDFNHLANYNANLPYGMVSDVFGNVFVAERQAGVIRCLNSNLTHGGKNSIGEILKNPVGIMIDKLGFIHVTDVTSGKIYTAQDGYLPCIGDISVYVYMPDGSPANGAKARIQIPSTGIAYNDNIYERGLACFSYVSIGENFVVTAEYGAYTGSVQGAIPKNEDHAQYTINLAASGSGKVSGKVRYDTGETAANAVVDIQYTGTSGTAATVANTNGEFIFNGLPDNETFMVTAFDPSTGASGTSLAHVTHYTPESLVQITIKKPKAPLSEFTNSNFSSGTLEGWEASNNVLLVPKEQTFPEGYAQSLAITSDGQNSGAESGYSAVVTTGGENISKGTLEQTFKIKSEQMGVLKGRLRFVTNEWPGRYGTEYNDSYIVKLISSGGVIVLAKGNLSSSALNNGVAGFNGAADEIDIDFNLWSYRGATLTISIDIFDDGDNQVDSGIIVSDFSFDTIF